MHGHAWSYLIDAVNSIVFSWRRNARYVTLSISCVELSNILSIIRAKWLEVNTRTTPPSH